MVTELLDILDGTAKKTGETITRDEAHLSGTWHGAFHCLILSERQGRGYAIFQKRSHEKLIAPDRYDVSVGGHYTAGEGPESAGPREIREELGLDVKFGDLVPLGKRVFVYCFTPGIREHEFQDVYLLRRDVNPGELTLQRGEVDAVLELDIDRGIELHSGRKSMVGGTLFRPGNPAEAVAVSARDFVPSVENYYLKLILLAKRYLKGEREGLVV